MNRNRKKRLTKRQIAINGGTSEARYFEWQKECRDRNRKTLAVIRNKKVRDR